MKIKLDDGAYKPVRAHRYDAGLDIMSRETVIIKARGSHVFDTGVHVEIPNGCVGLLKSKSGLNVNHGIISDGVIDAGYTGAIKAKLYNLSDQDYLVSAGDKITQLVVLQVKLVDVDVVDEVDGGDRGDNGFGSTGK